MKKVCFSIVLAHVLLSGSTTACVAASSYDSRMPRVAPDFNAPAAVLFHPMEPKNVPDFAQRPVTPAAQNGQGASPTTGTLLRSDLESATLPVQTRLKLVVEYPVDAKTSVAGDIFEAHVLQGESDGLAENVSLARFDVDGIPAAPAGEQKIDIVFDIDADGIFHCSVKHAGGTSQKVVLKRTTGYNQDQLEKLKRDEAMRAEREMEEANRVAAMVLAETSLSEAERVIAKFPEEQAQQLAGLRFCVKKLKDAMQSGSVRELENLRQALDSSLAQCMRQMSNR